MTEVDYFELQLIKLVFIARVTGEIASMEQYKKGICLNEDSNALCYCSVCELNIQNLGCKVTLKLRAYGKYIQSHC